ncbi:MAG: GGDEF domain-containing protein, partial [Lachnospiraceae bacterium]|nr:GGDEF domain-containing protein [Lachnospiraceae bacterium]
KREYYRYAREYPELKFTDINASELTLNKLRQKISMVGKDTILIYVLMTENASGKQYSEKEAIQFIMNNAKVPVFSMLEGGIGDGFIGGNVASMYKSGEIAADIALNVINGEKVSNMGVMESPNIYCIDQLVVKKFGLTMPDVPENSDVVNYQPPFLERNKEVIIPAGILVFSMLAVVFWAMYDNLKRRKLMEELEEARKIMESASLHDFLTGLGNRSKFMEDIENLVNTGTPCSIMMLDIDHFKHINDTYGHTAGDEALKQLAERLKGMQTPILTPYRFAGDEFIIILKSSQEKIKEKSAFQCYQLFDEPFMLAGEKRKVGGSIGIASYPMDAGSVEQLIICADDAMYQVKKSGRNNFAFYKADGEKKQRE